MHGTPVLGDGSVTWWFDALTVYLLTGAIMLGQLGIVNPTATPLKVKDVF
jgi:hypothetical protein